jgi:RNA 2',3'-cyclic 3'-phosphodiesterase
MQAKRIFIAFDISNEARTTAVDHLEKLKREFPDCHAAWTNANKLHYTMRFLGDVEVGKIEAVAQVVDETAAKSKAFDLRISGTGVFPSLNKARVIWLGTKGDLEEVALLKSGLDNRLAGLGFERESKRFTPHLTLARVKDLIGCRPLVEKHLESVVESAPFTVGEIIIYESQLRPTGSVYTVLKRARL